LNLAVDDLPVESATSRNPSRQSLAALDALNFFLADVRDGMGPFLGTFLRESHRWTPDHVGFAMAASQIGTLLAQTPAGALVDRIRWKRLAVMLAALTVGGACLLTYVMPTFWVVVLAQAVIGMAAAIFPPAIAAMTLGLVGRGLMPRQTGRNEAFNHAGNVIAAGLAGAAAYYFGYWAMFAVVAAMAVASAGAVALLRAREIDHDLARGADGEAELQDKPMVLSVVFLDKRIMVFMVSVVLFHFANAAMLPLVGQKSGDGLKSGAVVVMAACIIVAQLVMVPVAIAASRLAASRGRKPVFLVGFAVLPIRGVLYCLSINPVFLITVQLLDGIGVGIFGVLSVLMIADLTRGTGRFNLVQGAIATATGLGAGLSHLISGFVVAKAGFNAAFLMLAAIATFAALFFAFAMPETMVTGNLAESPHPLGVG